MFELKITGKDGVESVVENERYTPMLKLICDLLDEGRITQDEFHRLQGVLEEQRIRFNAELSPFAAKPGGRLG